MLSRVSPSGFIEPCLPSPADTPPLGSEWIHEIKHNGYRLMARRDHISIGARLLTRNGPDWAARYPRIVEAVNALKLRSYLIEGEAVACDRNGVAEFERLRRRREGPHAFLYAFDLLELNGNDLRGEPFEVRKATPGQPLAWLPTWLAVERTSRPPWRRRLPEGIVSKRLGSRYRSGRTKDRRAGLEAGGGRGLGAMSLDALKLPSPT